MSNEDRSVARVLMYKWSAWTEGRPMSDLRCVCRSTRDASE